MILKNKSMKSKNLTKIESRPVPDYDHIHLLNGLSLDQKNTWYKYMSYDRLMDCVRNKELVFVSPETWLDPFERRFWKTDYSRKNFKQPEIACMCLTSKSSTNEEASWKMYADSKSKALRISFNVTQLLKNLEKYAQEKDCTIYLGEAIYMKRTDILKLHEKVNIFFPSDNFSLEHYLTLMCLKRIAFEFENEIRIFLVKEKLPWAGEMKNIIKVPTTIIDKDIIPRITIGPLTPFSSNDPRRSLYNKIQSVEREVYRQRLAEVIEGCGVKQSQLYTDKNPLEEIEYIARI